MSDVTPGGSELHPRDDLGLGACSHANFSAIESVRLDRDDNPLKNAPHGAAAVADDEWPHPYPRSLAAYPLAWLKDGKYWPPVGRIDNAFGDRNLICTCPSVADLAS